MVTEDHDGMRLQPRPTEGADSRPAPRRSSFRWAAVALVVFSFAGMGFWMRHWLVGPEPESTPGGGAAPPMRLFRLWPQDRQPDLVLVLTGESWGFIQPCGCSSPQFGGLERRHNFIQSLTKERHWPVVALDLGDIAQETGPQALVKYRFFMEALQRINYTAVGVGRHEMSLPLIDALGEFALNNPSPRVVVANLRKAQANFPGMTAAWQLANNPRGPKVAVTGVVAESVADRIQDPAVGFDKVDKVLPGVLKAMEAKKPDLYVLLFQGSEKEAKECAQAFPKFHVILCLSREEEPSAKPEQVGDTLIIGVGWKGRCLGTVGAYATGKPERPFELHYELVRLGEEYQTPAGQEANDPMLTILENYTKEVKAHNYLARYGKTKHPIQLDPAFANAKYVGSDKCKSCHKNAYKVWQESPHAHAYDTLVSKAHRPSLRQYDGECIVCHVTGFKYESGFENAQSTPKLVDNGCENCHGPGSLHIEDKNNQTMQALMNPFKAPANETPAQKARRHNRMNDSCQVCHDWDNDVHWDFDKKWPLIAHPTPK
jgi:hypothetical protein